MCQLGFPASEEVSTGLNHPNSSLHTSKSGPTDRSRYFVLQKKKFNSNESRFPPDSWILKNTSSTYWPNLDHIWSFFNVGIRLWHLSNNIFWISSGFIRELTSCTLNIAHVEWNTEHKLILPAVFIFMGSRWAGSWSWSLILSLTESRADSLVWSILLITS